MLAVKKGGGRGRREGKAVWFCLWFVVLDVLSGICGIWIMCCAEV